MRIKGNKPKGKSVIYKQKQNNSNKSNIQRKIRAFARIQTYSLTAPCTWNQLRDHFATCLLDDVVALRKSSHHAYTNINGPTKFASCYDSRAICTLQNYKFTPWALWHLLHGNKFEHWILFCPPSGLFSRWNIAKNTIALCCCCQSFQIKETFLKEKKIKNIV